MIHDIVFGGLCRVSMSMPLTTRRMIWLSLWRSSEGTGDDTEMISHLSRSPCRIINDSEKDCWRRHQSCFLIFGASRQVPNESTRNMRWRKSFDFISRVVGILGKPPGHLFMPWGLHVSGQIPNNEQRISMVQLKTKVGF